MPDKNTIPVMANTRPWNEAILKGWRKFKTLPFNWKHRGWVLLYNTKGPSDGDAHERYGITESQPVGVIVGMAFVTHVRDGGDFYEAFFAALLVRFKTPQPYKPPRGAQRFSRMKLADARRLDRRAAALLAKGGA